MSLHFLGLNFYPITLSDQKNFQELLTKYPEQISGYSFASLAAWSQPFHFYWTLLEENILIARTYGKENHLHLLQPLGPPLSPAVQQHLLKEAALLSYPLEILSVSLAFREKNPAFCQTFTLHEDRAGANYVYLAKDLAFLEGAPFSKKRNLISQFYKLYPGFEIHRMGPNCHSACQEILIAMAQADLIEKNDPGLEAELCALEFSIKNLIKLNLQGITITIENKPCAFSIFEYRDNEMGVINFEKAKREYKGLYQIVNKETAKIILESGRSLINREEDLGNEGLRKAKLSYNPINLLSSDQLIFKK